MYPYAGECRNLEFGPFIDGKVLIGHVIDRYNVTSESGCELQCYFNERCVSYNLGPASIHAGSRVCELNNSSLGSHGEEFKTKHGYSFRTTKVLATIHGSSSVQVQHNKTDPNRGERERYFL